MTYKKVAAGLCVMVQPNNQFLLRGVVKVYHYIPAEYHVKKAL